MTASAIDTPRLVLTPVSPDDAHEAYPAFADRGLYRWMVGDPPADEAALPSDDPDDADEPLSEPDDAGELDFSP